MKKGINRQNTNLLSIQRAYQACLSQNMQHNVNETGFPECVYPVMILQTGYNCPIK